MIIDNAGVPDTVVSAHGRSRQLLLTFMAHGAFVADSPFVATFDETL